MVDKVLMSSAKEDWLTPPEIIEVVQQIMGGIDLDPCAEQGLEEVQMFGLWFGMMIVPIAGAAVIGEWLGPKLRAWWERRRR